MTAPAYFESLPYIDSPPSPSSLSAARALLAPPPSLPTQTPQPPPEPAPPLDTSRYEAQDASHDPLAPILRKTHTSATYLSSRVQNLRLLEQHGANAWLLANYHLENDLRKLEAELADTQRQIDEVNGVRASRQDAVKGEMEALEETWRKGVGRVLETEVAVLEVRKQIREELRSKSLQG